MLTFLLAWNPRRAAWRERSKLVETVQRQGHATTSWGTNTKAIREGDQLYVIRLGVPPKGIFAFGTAISSSYKAPHWDLEKRQAGRECWMIDCDIQQIVDLKTGPFLDLARLSNEVSDEINWTPQGSGKLIPTNAASRLADLWDLFYASRHI
ncbi:MAG: 5-methylcytosine-specific restriction protein A [Parasphingorhabdus sp.]|jgi:5-methylcytosine-specific restriction protein A